MTDKIEALLDGIAALKGWHNPESYTYQIKNPLHVKSYSILGKHEIDDEGRRIFKSWLGGYKASLFDLEQKVSGRSRAGLKATDKLANLLRVYGLTELLGQQQVVKFLRRALNDKEISLDTPLTYFQPTKEAGV